MTLTNSGQLADSVIRADHMAGPIQGHWTYDDYAALPDDGQRYEIIKGVLYMPPPAPGEPHQASNSLFLIRLGTHLVLPGLGRIYGPPFDVQLNPTNPISLTQPDVTVVLNTNLNVITPSRIIGAPDLIVEIASPSTARYDRTQKFQAYQTAGVIEYWIADPIDQAIEIFILRNGLYQSQGTFRGQQTLPSQVIPNLPVRVEQFFNW